MNKVWTLETLTLTGIPLLIVGLEQFIKYIIGYFDLNVSLTLSSIAIGQIFPYIIFENLLIGKVFKLTAKYSGQPNMLNITYQIDTTKNGKEIDQIKKLVYLIFLICLFLFIVTVYFSICGENFFTQNIFGILSVLMVWSFLIFV